MPPVDSAPVKGWPADVRKIEYKSSGDGSLQPALFYAPPGNASVPLLVALHTWSNDYTQADAGAYAVECIARGWAFIFPNFRGPNWTPEACGSDLVVADIRSAVEHAQQTVKIDTGRVYLAGASGGGFASLLMAGRAPELWAGVSAWVPITDLAAWHCHCTAAGHGYAGHMEKACGGTPGTSAEADLEYKARSAITHLANAKGLNLDINAGITDGHDGSVPISHSIRAFNLLAAPADRVSEADIAFFVEKAAVPPHLQQTVNDEMYGDKKVLFRRTSGRVRLTIFQGGHEIVYPAALAWLGKQKKV